MQDYIRNGRKQSTYNPDLLIRGKGVGWRTPSKWYRQTGNDYGDVPLIAKFRPTGWAKSYEYELTFNDRKNSRADDLTLSINRIDERNNVLSTRKVLGLTTECVNKACPFCGNLVVMTDITKCWKCTNEGCQFNYTADTCKLLYEEYRLDKNVKNVQRRFSNFENLMALNQESDMTVDTNRYDEL